MAYVLVKGGTPVFVGASTDTKPTAGVPSGAHAIERDTGAEYIYDGSTWGALASGGGTAVVNFGTAISGQGLEVGGSGPIGWQSSVRKHIDDDNPLVVITGAVPTGRPIVIYDTDGNEALVTTGGLNVDPQALSSLLDSITAVVVSDGCSTYRVLWPNNTTGVVILAAPGQLMGYEVFNLNAAARFVKLYNKATAPTGSDTPIRTIVVPGGTAGSGAIRSTAMVGTNFSAGLSIRVTTGIADADTGAPTASETAVHIDYLAS